MSSRAAVVADDWARVILPEIQRRSVPLHSLACEASPEWSPEPGIYVLWLPPRLAFAQRILCAQQNLALITDLVAEWYRVDLVVRVLVDS